MFDFETASYFPIFEINLVSALRDFLRIPFIAVSVWMCLMRIIRSGRLINIYYVPGFSHRPGIHRWGIRDTEGILPDSGARERL